MSGKTWKRSNAPIFWLLFGGGGSLSSLFGPALVFVTGIAVPLGLLATGTMGYARMLALVTNPLGKLIVFGVVLLFAWHAMHRIYKSLHDVGIPPGTASKLVCYGVAAALTAVAGVALLRIGF